MKLAVLTDHIPLNREWTSKPSPSPSPSPSILEMLDSQHCQYPKAADNILINVNQPISLKDILSTTADNRLL